MTIYTKDPTPSGLAEVNQLALSRGILVRVDLIFDNCLEPLTCSLDCSLIDVTTDPPEP